MKQTKKPNMPDLPTLEASSGQEVGFTSPSPSRILPHNEDQQSKNNGNQDTDLHFASFLLFNELPDPSQEIAIQRGYDTDTFTCFPRLPIEIRFKIWRYSYPAPRAINLLPRCQGYCLHELVGLPQRHRIADSSRFQVVTLRRSRVPLPITLQINRESRRETLMNYILVFRHENDLRSSNELTVVRIDNGPFCFHPLRDTTFIYWCAFRWLPNLSPDFTSGWVSQPEHVENVKRISRLEIREMIWNRYLLHFLRLYNSEDLSVFESSSFLREYWDHPGPLRNLLKFPGLRSLHVSLQFPSAAERKYMGGFEVASLECEEELAFFLERHKAKFGGVVPAVTISFCKQLYQQIPYRTF